MGATPGIIITDRDKERLGYVVEAWMGRPPFADMADFLDEELARAEVVPSEAIEPTVATMNSRVEFADPATGQRRCVTIAYPDQTDPRAERVSVLSPVGAALLGLTEGQEMTWQASDGRSGRVALLKVHFQPEAAGQYDL